jgi:hypothetical protein
MATFNNGEAGLSVRTKLNNVLQHADGTTGTLTFNDAGADVDIRIEGVGQTHAFFLDAGTSNIGIGTSTASSKLTVGGDITSSGVTTAVAMRDNTNRRITSPGGGSYSPGLATGTGAIAVTLPVGYTNHMVKITLSVYEYAIQESFDVIVSGYNYSVGSQWLNCSAAIISNNSTDRDYTVRFGFNATSSKCIIYIGELASTWSYPQVHIKDIQVAHTSTGLDAWDDGWSIGLEASAFQNVTSTLTNNRVGARLIGTGQTTAALTDAGARSDLLRLSSVGTAAGTGGGIIFTSSQGDSANSVGMAAIKSLLQDGSSNTRGDLAFSTRNSATDTNLTERMRITYGGNLGIGTTTPANIGAGYKALTINDTTAGVLELQAGGVSQFRLFGNASENRLGGLTAVPVTIHTNSAERMRIDASGNVGLGITNPAYKLVVSAGGASGIEFGPAYSGSANLVQHYNRSGGVYVDAVNDAAQHRFSTVGTERMRIDTSGNLGISVTPPANTTYPGIFFPQSGIFDYQGDGWLFYNAYTTGVGALKYRATGLQVAAYSFGQAGTHTWHSAPSGTANGAITLTQRMILDNAGQLGIGTNSPNGKLHVNANGGTAILEGTDHSYLSFYPRTYATGRKAYAGFASTSITNFSIVNEDTGSILLGTNGSTSNFIISPLGNIGINNTPRTWGSTFKAISINGAGSHIASNGSNRIELGTNSYLDTDNTTRRYDVTQAATTYMQATGEHQWYTAPSGTAGAAITFTQVMTLDNTGELGIGTTSPQAKLDVRGAALGGTATNSSLITHFAAPDANLSQLRVLNYRHTTGTDHTTGEMRLQKRVDATDFGYIGFRHNAITFGTTAEQLRIDSTGNVGIGTASPVAKLSVATTSSDGNVTAWGTGQFLVSPAGGSTSLGLAISVNTVNDTTNISSLSPNVAWRDLNYRALSHIFYSGGSERMRLDASGNLGLGVTPGTWGSSYRAAEVRTSAVYDELGTLGGLAFNSRYNGTNWVYKGTGGNATAMRYEQITGEHRWYNAPSGIAGNAITFTQAMTLTASGELLVGTASGDGRLTVKSASEQSYGSLDTTSADSGYLALKAQGSIYGYLGQASTLAFGGAGTDTALSSLANLVLVTDGLERVRIDSVGRVGIGGTANASSILDVQSTTRGFLPPRMTTTQRNAISSPAAGLVIYNTTTSREEGYDGTAWIPKIPLDIEEDRIINGAFDVWQRGTSFTTTTYGADRWANVNGGGTVTTTRQSFTLGDMLGMNNPTFFLRQSISGQTLASQYAQVYQYVEGVRSYAGQTITILGWAKRATAGNIVINWDQFFGTGGTPSTATTGSPQTLALTTSWTPFAATFTIPSVTGKTLGTSNTDGLRIVFWNSAGSDFNAATNSLGLQTTDVDFWGIHIREGVWTTADALLYRQKSLVSEVAKCYRYYYRVTTTGIQQVLAAGYNTSTTVSRFIMHFPVPMRAAPALLEQSGTAGNYGVFNAATITTCTGVPTYQTSSQFSGQITTTTGATLVAGQGSILGSLTAGAYLAWTAEI